MFRSGSSVAPSADDSTRRIGFGSPNRRTQSAPASTPTDRSVLTALMLSDLAIATLNGTDALDVEPS